MKNKTLFMLVVLSQLIIIIGLSFYIRQKNKKVLGHSITTITKENIIISDDQTDYMKNFYEPEPNKIILDDFDWLPKPARYTINSDSLNERREYATEKSADTIRIITIGDSFTFGSFVDTQDNYPEQLEDILNNNCRGPQKYEVINLGVAGYDIQYPVERFIKRGIKYNPDLVVWLINYWDFLKIDEILINRVQEITNEATESGTYDARVQISGRYFAWGQAQDELFETMKDKLIDKQFGYFKKFRENYTGKLVIIVLSYPGDSEEKIKNFNEFLTRAKKHDENVFIFSDISYNDLETLKVDPHPSVTDHKHIAQELDNYLRKNYFINCE